MWDLRASFVDGTRRAEPVAEPNGRFQSAGEGADVQNCSRVVPSSPSVRFFPSPWRAGHPCPSVFLWAGKAREETFRTQSGLHEAVVPRGVVPSQCFLACLGLPPCAGFQDTCHAPTFQMGHLLEHVSWRWSEVWYRQISSWPPSTAGRRSEAKSCVAPSRTFCCCVLGSPSSENCPCLQFPTPAFSAHRTLRRV